MKYSFLIFFIFTLIVLFGCQSKPPAQDAQTNQPLGSAVKINQDNSNRNDMTNINNLNSIIMGNLNNNNLNNLNNNINNNTNNLNNNINNSDDKVSDDITLTPQSLSRNSSIAH